ncbi:amino acid ABC transporter substrate-binding protein [Ramlibacter sp. G-1-2-2]|uniref:Amino acid ABC transporter substrate-binding protein n=1 Tax=Ramlibacter agri TaxID=2728837 RepID=A0A848H1G7_9BURK|nr:amino acid ABC transporter substrate-binding protein [Ramlibacter agri]NML43369.1 amino acid ABC transporter substrate-binding protein [Ramlibacter agri]
MKALHALCAAALALCATAAGAAGTLDKVRDSGKLTIGFMDSRPFSYTEGGKAGGFAIALCEKLADAIKAQLNLPALAVDWQAVKPDEAFKAVDQGRIDLLCGAVPSLERRALVDFSIPIALTGTGAAVRSDAPPRLVQALSGLIRPDWPVWRGSADQAPQRVRLAVVEGIPLEEALASTLRQRRIVADIVTVKSPDAGLQLLASRGADAFLNDRSFLVDAVARDKQQAGIQVLDRIFRRDVVALAVRRNDADFRLLVDRSLSQLYRSSDMVALYTKYFGPPPAMTQDFFNLVALPD